MTDSQRLEKLIEWSRLSVRAFALELGYDRPDVCYKVLKEKNGISTKLAQRITAKYPNVSKSWLLAGEGEMINKSNSQSITGHHSNNTQTYVEGNQTVNEPKENYPNAQQEIENLKQQLKEKNKEIEFLRSMLSNLTKKE